MVSARGAQLTIFFSKLTLSNGMPHRHLSQISSSFAGKIGDDDKRIWVFRDPAAAFSLVAIPEVSAVLGVPPSTFRTWLTSIHVQQTSCASVLGPLR